MNNSGLVKKQRFFGYTYKIDRIILYGSYARGDFNLESDVDIIIFIRLADVLCSAIHFPLSGRIRYLNPSERAHGVQTKCGIPVSGR